MKKTLLTMTLAAVVAVASAQKPVTGGMGLTGGLTTITGTANTSSPSGTLMFKYYMKDNIAFRAGVNFGGSKTNGTDVNLPLGGPIADSTKVTTVLSGGNSWAINLGGQYSMKGGEKLEPYMSADIILGGGAAQDSDVKTEHLKNAPGFQRGDFFQTVLTSASTFTFGIQVGAGFNYWLASNLAIGAEYNYGYKTTSTSGGKVATSGIIGGVALPAGNATNNDTNSSGGFGTQGGAITLSWMF